MTPCPLWGPLSSLRPSVSSTALCTHYGPLFPLRHSVPSEKQETSETTLLFHEKFCKMCFVKTPRVIVIYFVSAIIVIIVIIMIITQAKYSAIIAK
jgi:hypothetical protein